MLLRNGKQTIMTTISFTLQKNKNQNPHAHAEGHEFEYLKEQMDSTEDVHFVNVGAFYGDREFVALIQEFEEEWLGKQTYYVKKDEKPYVCKLDDENVICNFKFYSDETCSVKAGILCLVNDKEVDDFRWAYFNLTGSLIINMHASYDD